MKAADALWEQACALYARPGAREELLGLQERCGADVPILLWAAALAVNGEKLDMPIAREARAKAEPIAECVRAVRAMRRKLADLAPARAAEPARAALLNGELALERLQIEALAAYLGRPQSAGAMLENLQTALAACGCFASPESVESLAQLLGKD